MLKPPAAPQPLAPASYHIDELVGVVYLSLRGELTIELLRAALAGVMGSPGLRRGLPFYVDCRVLTSIPTPAEIDAFAADLSSHRGAVRGKAAIVVMTRMGMDYGDMWHAVAGSMNADIEVFTSPADARAWLGLPPEPGVI